MRELKFDLGKVSSKEEFHKVVAKELHFPEWYGENWDAFWDAITGLVEMPEKTIFINFKSFEDSLPLESKMLLDLAIEYNQQSLESRIEII